MMNHDKIISSVYYVAGLLEGLTCMQGQTITEGMTSILADCVDRLEIIGSALQAEAVIKCDENGITFIAKK